MPAILNPLNESEENMSDTLSLPTIRLRLKPMRNLVGILAFHCCEIPRNVECNDGQARQIHLPSHDANGVPIDSESWVGRVFGVGPEASRDVKFGDLVRLHGWNGDAFKPLHWFKRPLRTCHGEPNPNADYLLEDADGSGGLIEAKGSQWHAWITADHILYRIQRMDKSEPPGEYPVSKRVLVRHDDKATNGIIDIAWARDWGGPGVAEFIGAQVRSVQLGNRVLVPRGKGSHWEIERGRYTILRESDLLPMQWTGEHKIELKRMESIPENEDTAFQEAIALEMMRKRRGTVQTGYTGRNGR